jgi:hypothetical protein
MGELCGYMDAVEGRRGELKQRLELILQGTIKLELSGWWLQTIEESSDQFLEDHGYVKNAIPDNYIDDAPEDISVVTNN